MNTHTEYRVIYKDRALGREYEWGTYFTLRGAESNAYDLCHKRLDPAEWRIESRTVSYSDWKAV